MIFYIIGNRKCSWIAIVKTKCAKSTRLERTKDTNMMKEEIERETERLK
jgi:hypothetical protein